MDLQTLFIETTIDKNDGQTIIDILDKGIERDIIRLDNILHIDTHEEHEEIQYRIEQLREFASLLGVKSKFSLPEEEYREPF